MIVLRALAALLSYPREEIRQALPEIAEVIRSSRLIAKRQQQDLLELVEVLGAGDLLETEARYVDVFDRGRSTSLNLFEHLHGDGRERGDAMVELMELYRRAGFELSTPELPDFLPVVLEYLSCRNLAEAQALLSDCAHILERLGRALIARRSPYAAVPQALLTLAGERPVDVIAVAPADDPPETMDEQWAEPAAFGKQPAP